MALRISGKNLDIGASLRGHIEARLSAATEKYFDGGVLGHVTIAHEGSGYRTECVLHLASGITLTAEAEAHEAYASFDKTADRIDKRLRRYKQRLKTHHVAGGGQGRDSEPEMASYIIAAPDEDAEEPEAFSPVIVAESTMRLKTLSVAQAVTELDLTGAPVVVFRHATQERLNLVYRRPDGNIGWIDPDGRARG